jgi:alpha-N-arabinofuranosidase
MCRKTAAEYGRIACETAKLMKWTDPSIELAVCGSSARWVPTFPAWEAEVLEHCFDYVEYVSVHTYFNNPGDDTPGHLAKPDLMGQFIDEVAATCDYVAAKQRSAKRIQLSFDEWNVWIQYHSPRNEEKADEWPVAPHLLEDIYSMEDALVVGGMLIALLNHADRVKIGCLAQVVNVIAPIMTKKGGPAWRQTIFYPFAHASNYGRGTVLRQAIDSPVYDTKERQAAPYYAGASMLDPENGALTLFAINRSVSESLEITVDLRGFDAFQVTEWITLRHDDLKTVNTCDHPDAVKPIRTSGAAVNKGNLTAVLSPASWNVIRLLPKGQ